MSRNDVESQLRAFASTVVSMSEPLDYEGLLSTARPRSSWRGRRALLGALVVVSLVIVSIVAVVSRDSTGPRISVGDGATGVDSSSSLRLLVLSPSGGSWLAFVVYNTAGDVVPYSHTGLIEALEGSHWHRVAWFSASLFGGTRPGTLAKSGDDQVSNPLDTSVRPHAFGIVQWLDVSSLAVGRYRVHEDDNTAEFNVQQSLAGQPPPTDAVLQPRLDVEPGSIPSEAATVLLSTNTAAGDLSDSARVDSELAMTVNVRVWSSREWQFVTRLPLRRITSASVSVTLPKLPVGLYELSREGSSARPTGWLFVAPQP